jgi:hypothetical protein
MVVERSYHSKQPGIGLGPLPYETKSEPNLTEADDLD